MTKIKKIKELRKIPSKIKELSAPRDESELEEDIEQEESHEFQNFILSESPEPRIPRTRQGPQISQASVNLEEEIPQGAQTNQQEQSGLELYEAGRNLAGSSGQYYDSSSESSAALRTRGIGRDFAMSRGTQRSALPENNANSLDAERSLMRQRALERQEEARQATQQYEDQGRPEEGRRRKDAWDR